MAKIDYTLQGKVYSYTTSEAKTISDNPPYQKENWGESKYDKLKRAMRKYLAKQKNQDSRCVYCRSRVPAGGTSVALEHLVPKDPKPTWMFVAENLTLVCTSCNSSKKDQNPLRKPFTSYGNAESDFPSAYAEFIIFNPYHDTWSNNFEIEDEIFLVPKKHTKGPATYKMCGMNRYQIIVDYADQLDSKQNTVRSLTKRLRKTKDKAEQQALQDAIDYYL